MEQIIEAFTKLEESLAVPEPGLRSARAEKRGLEQRLADTVLTAYGRLNGMRKSKEVPVTRCPPGIAAGATFQETPFGSWADRVDADADDPPENPMDSTGGDDTIERTSFERELRKL